MATLRAWEEPTEGRNGLTQKGATRLVQSLRDMSIYCTEDWLLSGDGPGPKLLSALPSLDNKDEPTVEWGEEESIMRDIDSFKSNNPNPVVAIVNDGAMLPRFSYGDYVGGSMVVGEEISSLVGVDCIIEMDGKTLIRRITSGSEGRYTLAALNLDASIQDSILTDVELVSAAAIVWHRWRRKMNDIKV